MVRTVWKNCDMRNERVENKCQHETQNHLDLRRGTGASEDWCGKDYSADTYQYQNKSQ
tara:strand:- start:757 stop:930 length:174 start_codon:yes stop_codon:yes gene_type:complete